MQRAAASAIVTSALLLVVCGCGDDDVVLPGLDAGTDMTMPPPVDGGDLDNGGDDGGTVDVDAGPCGLRRRMLRGRR